MQTATETTPTIGQIIAQQMGGTRRLNMFAGAYDFIAIKNGLQFSIPGKGFARNSINIVSIMLTPSDDYKMVFMRKRGSLVKVVREVEGVYCDQLVSIFEDATGLYLSF